MKYFQKINSGDQNEYKNIIWDLFIKLQII